MLRRQELHAVSKTETLSCKHIGTRKKHVNAKEEHTARAILTCNGTEEEQEASNIRHRYQYASLRSNGLWVVAANT